MRVVNVNTGATDKEMVLSICALRGNRSRIGQLENKYPHQETCDEKRELEDLDRL